MMLQVNYLHSMISMDLSLVIKISNSNENLNEYIQIQGKFRLKYYFNDESLYSASNNERFV